MRDLNQRVPSVVRVVLTALAVVSGRAWFLYRDERGRTRLWFGRL
jgi:hypothetical protein